jgi:hypothetical protein
MKVTNIDGDDTTGVGFDLEGNGDILTGIYNVGMVNAKIAESERKISGLESALNNSSLSDQLALLKSFQIDLDKEIERKNSLMELKTTLETEAAKAIE